MGPYEETSDPTDRYNCTAWAANDTNRWWEPNPTGLGGYHWPEGVPREGSIRAYTAAFEALGYEVCESVELEPGYEKIAIYVNDSALPQHVARQLPSGKWTSKLGKGHDIEHDRPSSVAGLVYGGVAVVMRRRLKQEIPFEKTPTEVPTAIPPISK